MNQRDVKTKIDVIIDNLDKLTKQVKSEMAYPFLYSDSLF